jgi:hypothetical protein
MPSEQGPLNQADLQLLRLKSENSPLVMGCYGMGLCRHSAQDTGLGLVLRCKRSAATCILSALRTAGPLPLKSPVSGAAWLRAAGLRNRPGAMSVIAWTGSRASK